MPKATDGTGHAVAPGPRRGREEPEATAWGLSVSAPAWAGQLLPSQGQVAPGGPALLTAMTVAEGRAGPTASRIPQRLQVWLRAALLASVFLGGSKGAGTRGRQACSARLVAAVNEGPPLPDPRVFSRFYRQLVHLPLETELSRRLVEA